MANLRVGRRSGRIFRGGRSVRETAWVNIATTSTGLAPSTGVLFSGFSAAALGLRPFTIVRVRGWLSLSSDQSIAVETYAGSLGMAVVSDQAFAIGVTAVPTPQTDKDSDLWFVYEELAGTIIAVTSTGIDGGTVSKAFDSRAMRKVEDGQDVAIVVEGAAGFSGSTLNKGGRMLIKLH